MHILIIPSVFFDEERKPNAGNFQKDHAFLFQKKGHKAGVLAIKPRASFGDLYLAVKGLTRSQNRRQFRMIFLHFYIFFITLLKPLNRCFKSYKLKDINVVKYLGGYGLIHYKNYEKVVDHWKNIGEKAYIQYVKFNGKPDIIHVHNVIYAGVVARFLSDKFRIPFILTERSSQHVMQYMDKELCKLVENEFKNISEINSVSPTLGKQLEEKYNLTPGSIKWLPNMVNSIFISHKNVINTVFNESDKFVFLNIANLIRLKGQSELIRAFSKNYKGNLKFRLRIGGEGVEHMRLKMLIKELDIENQVELLGQLSREEVKEEMVNCNIFVLPSHYETFGVVLIEALALGKPVLSTNCGGPESIVNEKNGILVPPKDEVALAQGMEIMVRNLEDFCKSEIKQNLIDRFGPESFYRRAMNSYKQAIDNYHH